MNFGLHFMGFENGRLSLFHSSDVQSGIFGREKSGIYATENDSWRIFCIRSGI